jgi:F-box-like
MTDLRRLPTELWCNICTSLDLDDIISANRTCKTWYASLNDTNVWEVALRRTLSGYPLERITVPSVLSQLERPASMDFSKPGQTAVNLEDWTHSYKQRAIFLTHVIKVQKELIGIMRSRTTGLYTTEESEPLFNGRYLAEIEDQAGGYIPFDLVIYLVKFSHLLVPQCLPYVEHSMFALACTLYFTDPYLWKCNNSEATFAGYEDMALQVTEEMRQDNLLIVDIHEAVNEETLESSWFEDACLLYST